MRKNLVAEMLAHLRQHLLEIAFSLSKPLTTIILGMPYSVGVFPDRVGADADAVLRVHDDEREIADAQRAETFADEVRVARACQ